MRRKKTKRTPEPGDLMEVFCDCDECKDENSLGGKGIWAEKLDFDPNEKKYGIGTRFVILDNDVILGDDEHLASECYYKVAIDGEVRYVHHWDIEEYGKIIE